MNIDTDFYKMIKSKMKSKGFTTFKSLVIYLLTKFFEENSNSDK